MKRKVVRRERADKPKPYTVKDSPLHGKGCYANRLIKSGERIIQYVGEKVTKAESTRRTTALSEVAEATGCASVYVFQLNKTYDIDGDFEWNDARLINHSCDPNCETYISKGKIWFYALRDIEEGEELLFNYGFAYDKDYDYHPCYCESERCIGFIMNEAEWFKVQRNLKRLYTQWLGNSNLLSGYDPHTRIVWYETEEGGDSVWAIDEAKTQCARALLKLPRFSERTDLDEDGEALRHNPVHLTEREVERRNPFIFTPIKNWKRWGKRAQHMVEISNR